MAFTAKDVQTLRERTGAGMMDCKKALTSSDGDFEKAIEFLREKGLAAAAKKAGRIASEGMVYSTVCEQSGVGVIVEINSETDFVAKNEDFVKFCKDVAAVIGAHNPADVEQLGALPYPGSELTVKAMTSEKVLTIGENIQIRRFARYEGAMNVPYVHQGGRIGVLTALEVSDNLKGSPVVFELGRDLCMQAAAMRPQWLDKSEVTQEDLEKEKAILLAQALNEGKPQAVAEKIVMGRINKFYEENCLLQQVFVKDNKLSVEKHVAQVANQLSGEIKVVAFTRFERGEGLEKREDNFVEEVAKMTGK